MRVLITGEAGFIATNLLVAFEKNSHQVIHIEDANVIRLQKSGEVCVHRNDSEAWAWHLKNLQVDLVVHNAAVVGTDVVALNSKEASLTNIAGTYNISLAAKRASIPVCYMGTTVIYDTAKYQHERITEKSDVCPMTFYGIQKLAGEHIVSSHVKDWMTIRPLFAYGGVGDMNSLIAKTIYAFLNKQESIDMFLDPTRIKDYLHVDDFCQAVVTACEMGLWGNDYNIAAETPQVTLEIIDMMAEIVNASIEKFINWHPETDYLGNHMLSSEKFRKISNWHPKLSLRNGIKKVKNSIMIADPGYDPLIHLKKAKEEGVDLTDFYNSNI